MNPSFEDTIICPNGLFINATLNDWTLPINHWGTSDHFHTCSNGSRGIPNNLAGFQDTCTGNSYTGTIIYTTHPQYSEREYLTGELSTPLVYNQCYRVSFKYSLGETSDYSIFNYGILFTDSIPSAGSIWHVEELNYSPQIEVNQWMYDKKDWVKIERYYVAQGGEKYITLGNFESNTNTIARFEGNGTNNGTYKSSYVYLDDIHVEVVPTDSMPQIDLGNDTILCEGQKLIFDSLLPNNPIYVWNNLLETSDSLFTIDSSGVYWVEAYNGCSYTSDSINVIVLESEVTNIHSVSYDSLYCNLEQVTLDAGYSIMNEDKYTWNTNEETRTIKVVEEGKYEVKVENKCSKVTSTFDVKFERSEEVYTPINVFTPNGDGHNDLFTIYDGNSYEYTLEIYNRWGKLIWKTNNPQNHWDGSEVNDGTYYYHLSFRNCAGETIEKKNTVQLLR